MAGPRIVAAVFAALAGLAAGPVRAGQPDTLITFQTLDWPPFYGASLPGGGPLVRLTRQALTRQGYRIEVDFTNWKRATMAVADGQVDFLLGAWITEDRKARYAFTKPLALTRDVFVARAGFERRRYASLADLKGYTIGVGRGWDFGARLERADLTLFEASHQEKLLTLLFADRIDLLLETKAVVRAELAQQPAYGWDDVRVLEPPYRTGRLAHAVAADHPRRAELLGAVNAGLAKLRADGTYREILPPERFQLPGDA